MPQTTIVVWIDSDDFRHVQRAYKAVHLTPSQIVQIAVDRFVHQAEYRRKHLFSSPQSLDRDDDVEGYPGRVVTGTKISVRIDVDQRNRLKSLLTDPRFGLGSFVRGAILSPGTVLDSSFLHDVFATMVVEDNGMIMPWVDAPQS